MSFLASGSDGAHRFPYGAGLDNLGLDERAVFATGFSNGGDRSFLGAQKRPSRPPSPQ